LDLSGRTEEEEVNRKVLNEVLFNFCPSTNIVRMIKMWGM